MSEHVSDLALDALRLGQASPDVLGHVESCAQCRARRDVLGADAAQFAARFVPASLAAETFARAEEKRGGWARGWLALPALAAAFAIFIAVTPRDTVRTKGAPGVEVYVVDGSDARTLMTGPVAPDARLAVHVTPVGARFVRLLWESAPGDFGALYPAVDARAWKLDGPAWLHREVVLDGALGPERLGAVECEAPVDHQTATQLLAGDFREDCVVEWVSIQKR